MDPEECPHLWLRLQELHHPVGRHAALLPLAAHLEALHLWADHRQEGHREGRLLWEVHPLEEHRLWAGPQLSRLDPKARDPQ